MEPDKNKDSLKIINTIMQIFFNNHYDFVIKIITRSDTFNLYCTYFSSL